MQENNAALRIGRDVLVAGERKVLAGSRVTSQCIRPASSTATRQAIRWVFEFEWLDGRSGRMEELVWQRWKANASPRKSSSTTRRR